MRVKVVSMMKILLFFCLRVSKDRKVALCYIYKCTIHEIKTLFTQCPVMNVVENMVTTQKSNILLNSYWWKKKNASFQISLEFSDFVLRLTCSLDAF